MNMKKIVTSIVISVLISAGLYYGIAAVAPTEAIRAILTNKFDLTMCVMFGAGFGVVYLLSSYRKAATPEADIPMKKYEYLYNQCDAELKAELDKLSDEDKLRYVESTEALLDNNKKNDLNNYVFKLRTPQKSGTMKMLGNVAFVAMLAFVGYTGYETFSEVKPALDEHRAAMNAIDNKSEPNEETTIENETSDVQMLYIDGLPPIKLVGNNSLNKSDVDNLIENNIKTLPQKVLDAHSMICIYSPSEFTKVRTEYEVGIVLGFATWEKVAHYPINSEKSTIIHEAFHVLDFYNEDNDIGFSTSSQEFINMYNASPNSITRYGSTNIDEFFAEAGMMYVNSPSSLKSKNIDVYNYFNNKLGLYK